MNYSTPQKLGWFFAATHALAFAFTAVYAHLSSDGQAPLIWMIWAVIDLPWSLIYFVAGESYSAWLHSVSQLSVAAANIFYLPHVIHGFVGTIWWYFLPKVSAQLWLDHRLKKSGQKVLDSN